MKARGVKKVKKRGLTLIELVVVVALISILAITLAPRFKNQIAKAKDSKAISVLSSLRSQSEMYYAGKEKAVYQSGELSEGEALGILIQKLDLGGQKLFDKGSDGNKNGIWEATEVDIPVGGHRISAQSQLVVFNGYMGFTFENPEGTSGDGVEIWFKHFPGVGDYDTVRKKWIEY